jgi:pimeloyl-ACP methyl ester carboxylesterase
MRSRASEVNEPTESGDRPMTGTITTADVRLADGTRIPYAYVGGSNGSTPPLVLIHGLGDSWRSFETVLSLVEPHVGAYALTQRGHGDADRPTAGYRTDDLAADVAEFLDLVDIGRAVLVGHSMGASVAARVAVHHPERVAGLVMIGAVARPAANPAIDEFMKVVDSLTDPVDPDFVADFQQGTAAQPVPEEFMAMAIAESAKLPAHVWQAAVLGFTQTDHLAGLGSITAPTLVLWGDQDGFGPRDDQELLAASIPNAVLTVYVGTGHAVHWEQPERVVGDLVGFVAQRVS